jgi:hypothetical protein
LLSGGCYHPVAKTHFGSKIHRPEEDEEEESDITQSPKNLPMKNLLLLLFLLLLLLATSWNPSEPCSLRPTSNNHQTHHHFILQKMSTSCNKLETPSKQAQGASEELWQLQNLFHLQTSKLSFQLPKISFKTPNFKTLFSASKNIF